MQLFSQQCVSLVLRGLGTFEIDKLKPGEQEGQMTSNVTCVQFEAGSQSRFAPIVDFCWVKGRAFAGAKADYAEADASGSPEWR